ncbi:MAG: hypothetical protein WBK95_02815 [Sulfurimonas sp.]|jgi:cell division protein FtsL|nr:hypothetical protein [Sulfurimonas sp.]MDD3060493.1 hypothetical protein [Sulfurimonas sp.]MDD5203355.1 hypothetical protein [Sulfurimonas sp.]
MSEKSELLDEVKVVLVPKKVLDFSYFLNVFLILTLVCIFAFPGVYIHQQIYFKSRDISKLKSEHDTLKEENRIIRASVESIRFKNQILDTLF